MKSRFFIAAALLLGLAVGCEKEVIGTLSEIQVSQSYVSIDVNGSTSTIDVNATDNWVIDEASVPSWLTISPMSGSAGKSQISFKADATKSTNNADVWIICAGKLQHINVIQYAQKVDPVPITVQEAVNLIKAGTQGEGEYYVKGIVCKIDEISTNYGNATFYLSDDGSFVDGKWLEVYRGLWLNGGNFTKGDEFSVGDELTIAGVLIDYKGTPETKEKTAYVVSINKSLIKVDEVPEENIPIDGGNFDIKLTCKGDGIKVNIPNEAKSWLSVVGIATSGTTATVTFNAQPNKGGDRSTGLTFSTTSGGKTYSAAASVAQDGAIIDATIAEFNAAPVGDTQYRISGIVTKLEQDSEKYGANLYIKDATGETYIYGTTDAAGTVKTLASFGAKEGDIVEFVGKRGEHSGKAQIAKAVYQWHKAVSIKTAAEANAMADDNAKDPKNYIMLTGVVTKPTAAGRKWDIATYGNFDLVDETGDVYIYGVSTGWKGETKKFGTLGVNEGDTITIVGYKTSYTDKDGNFNNEVVGMYVSHETSTGPVDPVVSTSPATLGSEAIIAAHTADWSYTSGTKTITAADGSVWTAINTYASAGQSTIQMNKGKGSFFVTPMVAEGKAISKLTVVFNTMNDGSGTNTVTRTLDVFDGEEKVLSEVTGEALSKGVDISGTHRQLKVAPNETTGGACYIVSATIEFK